MVETSYVVLAGGVGAAKFIDGLAHVISQESLKIVINTGDDIELFGLRVSPDIDIITYTLAGEIDEQKGWGFKNETFNCLNVLKKYYHYGWFNLGDKDLATHLFRTDLFKQGFNKAEITSIICKRLNVKAELFPMCNEDVQTTIITENNSLHFEEYYIKYNCEPEIKGLKFKGIGEAKPIKEVLRYIKKAKKIIICPSNPVVSIGTILQVKGIRSALKEAKEKVFAISPIIEGKPIKGPADKLMNFLNLEISCLGVAKYYQEFLGHLIIDNKDCHLKPEIQDLGIKAYCFNTIMENLDKKKNLAQFVLSLKD